MTKCDDYSVYLFAEFWTWKNVDDFQVIQLQPKRVWLYVLNKDILWSFLLLNIQNG